MTSKRTVAGVTLIAALPAAALGYFLVSTFLLRLGQLNAMGTMFMVLYAATLVACAGVVFLPLGVLIFGPKSSAAPEAESTGTEGPPPSEEVASEPLEEPGLEADDEDKSSLMSAEIPAAISTGEFDVVEPMHTQEGLEVVDVQPSDEGLDALSDEFTLEDEPEPEPPKKKKK